MFWANTSFILEDSVYRQRFTSVVHHMDAARIKCFVAEFDPQLFHLDEVAAAQRSLRVVSKRLHTLAIFYAALSDRAAYLSPTPYWPGWGS